MLILLFVAFASGLTTILAPCIWPLLPIVLAASSSGEDKKPLGIAIGVSTSFAIFTLTISYVVRILPIDPNSIRLLSVIIISFLGASMLIPKLSALSDKFVTVFSNRFLNTTFERHDGFLPGLVTGLALGVVWSPCAGPLLATIATLAATRSLNSEVVLVTIAYVLGVGIPLFLFALWGNKVVGKSRALSPYTGKIQKVAGVIMIFAAIAIYTNTDKVIETKLLNIFPTYQKYLNGFESTGQVAKQLNNLKNVGETNFKSTVDNGNLPKLGQAPEFIGITNWLNTDRPLTMQSLRGKVVLVDFWTYTCINCIRTLPHVTDWYEKYKDQGFIVIGVHTPEFEFEKNTLNVQNAIKQYNINYPVAQDNDYATWNAYQNQYWPAEYLIDAEGNVRHTNFGEGDYDGTEQAIQALLVEAGQQTQKDISNIADQTPHARITPETYLGLKRIERLASPERLQPGVMHTKFTANGTPPDDYFTYEGSWDLQEEFASTNIGGALNFNVNANKVFLVITPKDKNDKIKVLIDGNPVNQTNAGSDVKDGFVQLDNPRLYTLIDLHSDKPSRHILRLEFGTDGTQIFAFTFG